MTAETKMGDLMAEMPGARRALFAKYHLGGCQSCAFDDSETVGQLCERAELDAEEVMAHLLESHKHDLTMLMEPGEVAAMEDVMFVDVRTREEYRGGEDRRRAIFYAGASGGNFQTEAGRAGGVIRSHRKIRARSGRLVQGPFHSERFRLKRWHRCLEPRSGCQGDAIPCRGIGYHCPNNSRGAPILISKMGSTKEETAAQRSPSLRSSP